MRLELQNLSLRRAGRAVLCDVTLSLHGPAIVGLVGPNGGGKSTLLHTCTGLLHPDSGSIRVNDVPISELSTQARRGTIAFMSQRGGADPFLSVLQVAGLGVTEGDAPARWLARLGLQDLWDRPFGELSAGEQQRVRHARTCAQAAHVTLLDEPVSAQDMAGVVSMVESWRALRSAGHLVVVALHDLDLAAQVCDQLAILHQGALVAHGPPWDVLSNSRTQSAFAHAYELVQQGDRTSVWPRLSSP